LKQLLTVTKNNLTNTILTNTEWIITMHIDTANEVIACLGKQRTLFHYYKDRYSIGLLQQYVAQKSVPISKIKQSAFAQLAQKPRVKNIIAHLGNKPLDSHFLNAYDYDEKQIAHTLTLSTWGSSRSDWRYNQTSRRGHNLVLQLNFNQQHDTFFKSLGADEDYFNYYAHPTSEKRNTLAWARIDFDWKSNSALIEEVQSDWIRRVIWLKKRCQFMLTNRQQSLSDITNIYDIQCSFKRTLDYCNTVLSAHQTTWAETILWAAIDFLKNEIGMHDIFYHTEQSGKLLKNIDWSAPPQSIYTDLPRKFCFNTTEELPDFIMHEKAIRKTIKKQKGLTFQKLSLAT